MKITDLDNINMNEGLAYILGLIFPLYKEKEIGEKNYLLGCVNHNPSKLIQDDITAHFKNVNNLIKTYFADVKPLIRANKTAEFNISAKDGFSILIERDILFLEYNSILKYKVNELLLQNNKEVKKWFVRGCFDGRSSWDKSSHYLSLDVDRDYEKQELIKKIINEFGIEININRREQSHKKNDQIRIKSQFIKKYLEEIGMCSIGREKIIKEAID